MKYGTTCIIGVNYLILFYFVCLLILSHWLRSRMSSTCVSENIAFCASYTQSLLVMGPSSVPDTSLGFIESYCSPILKPHKDYKIGT